MAPAVYRVSQQRLVLSCVRLGLGALGLLGAIVAGGDAVQAVVGAALGAAVCGLALLTDRRWLFLRVPSADPLPDDARHVGVAGAVARGTVPSTAGLAVLTAVSLGFEPLLTGVLAGVLLGMGVVSLASWAEVVLWERRADVTLYADVDVHTRRYVARAHGPTGTARAGDTARTAGRATGESVRK